VFSPHSGTPPLPSYGGLPCLPKAMEGNKTSRFPPSYFVPSLWETP